jgi:hypothetical protein
MDGHGPDVPPGPAAAGANVGMLVSDILFIGFLLTFGLLVSSFPTS